MTLRIDNDVFPLNNISYVDLTTEPSDSDVMIQLRIHLKDRQILVYDERNYGGDLYELLDWIETQINEAY